MPWLLRPPNYKMHEHAKFIPQVPTYTSPLFHIKFQSCSNRIANSLLRSSLHVAAVDAPAVSAVVCRDSPLFNYALSGQVGQPKFLFFMHNVARLIQEKDSSMTHARIFYSSMLIPRPSSANLAVPIKR